MANDEALYANYDAGLEEIKGLVNTTIDDIASNVAELQRRLTAKNTENDQKALEVARLQTKLGTATKEHSDLTTMANEYKGQNTKIQGDFNRAQQENIEAQRGLTDARKAAETATQLMETRNKDLEDARAKADGVINGEVAAAKLEATRATDLVKQMNADVLAARTEKGEATAALNAANIKATDAASLATKAGEREASAKAGITSIKDELRAAQKQAVRCYKELEVIQKRLERLKAVSTPPPLPSQYRPDTGQKLVAQAAATAQAARAARTAGLPAAGLPTSNRRRGGKSKRRRRNSRKKKKSRRGGRKTARSKKKRKTRRSKRKTKRRSKRRSKRSKK